MMEDSIPEMDSMDSKAGTIILRKAMFKDLELIQYWDTKQHVKESDDDIDWEWERELGKEVVWREQLIAELEQRPLGFVQIIDPSREETHYWGDVEENVRAIDIWIGEETDLGKGYGTVIMTLAIKRCFKEHGVKAILIDPLDSNERAIKFYKRLGFEFVEKRRFGDSYCMVLRLTKLSWTEQSQVHL